MRQPYAMMVDMRAKPCLVVGGGKVAARKVNALIDAGAHVKVVSPAVTPFIKYWALSGRVEWFARPYQKEDGADQFLIVAATDDSVVNRTVYCHATMRNQWINVVDQPELCNFTIPSILKRGKLQIAISTQGASPSVAKKIRRELECMYGEEYELYLDLVQEMRELIRKKVTEKGLRYRLYKELASDRWIDACRKDPDRVRCKMVDWLEKIMMDQGRRKEGLWHADTCSRNKTKRVGADTNQLGDGTLAGTETGS